VAALAEVVATQVRAGPGCSAVVAADDSVWVWGGNEQDRLGLDKPYFLGFKVSPAIFNENKLCNKNQIKSRKPYKLLKKC